MVCICICECGHVHATEWVVYVWVWIFTCRRVCIVYVCCVCVFVWVWARTCHSVCVMYVCLCVCEREHTHAIVCVLCMCVCVWESMHMPQCVLYVWSVCVRESTLMPQCVLYVWVWACTCHNVCVEGRRQSSLLLETGSLRCFTHQAASPASGILWSVPPVSSQKPWHYRCTSRDLKLEPHSGVANPLGCRLPAPSALFVKEAPYRLPCFHLLIGH